MTAEETTDVIMKMMQKFVDTERFKIWAKSKNWRDQAERFIQFFIFQEKNSPPDSLNQVYAKGPFAGGSVRSVRDHGENLLKAIEDVKVPDDVVTLHDALEKFGRHTDNCHYYKLGHHYCTCGFKEALNREVQS